MATYRKLNQPKKFYKINYQITAPTIRVLDETGKQIDVLSLFDAKKMAQEAGLDLVEVAPNANPPVVKLIDFAKFKYQEAKKMKAEKKGIKGGDLKEIQMTPFIGEADFDTRVKKAIKYFTSGNKVKISVKFQGRQITHKEFGFNLVEKFKAGVAEFATIESEPRLIGKLLLATFTPVRKKKTNEDTVEKI